MILRQEYLEDLKDYIREMPDALFACNSKGVNKEALLSDGELMDQLWAGYQKSIEDYGCEPAFAFWDTMREVMDIPTQVQSGSDESQSTKRKVTVIVAGGMVTAAFSDDCDIDVDVIDLDDADMGDDETRDEMYKEVDRLEKEQRRVW